MGCGKASLGKITSCAVEWQDYHGITKGSSGWVECGVGALARECANNEQSCSSDTEVLFCLNLQAQQLNRN